ncbi:MarR family winged helix-turn-helix transcriptional regulator [Metabacillus malikii]|uniref:DNA-binding MarR family transcriptional regulator n=1 Tax=Metabacillus malikii TaxID=1504265 RepID=A0ABT9ZIS6_9BACI|nr:MarR family transcriptional regulator [Metabacillus malikii]MDQ0232180.1 DNA-binding MarR family transcriptional regulator [Metabacillus malikii]
MDPLELLIESERFSHDIKMVFIREYQKIMDKYELSSKQSVIVNFVHQKQQPTMGEIAQMIDATPSAASQFVKKLEQLGYLKREVNVDNRRETLVTLAEKGEQFFAEMEKVDTYIFKKYFLKLPADDIVEYHRILKELHSIVTSST